MRHLALLAALGMMGRNPVPARREDKEDNPFDFKTLLIMRGLPGSGKSKMAESLIGGQGRKRTAEVPDPDGGSPENYRFTVCKHGVVCTTDAYFYDSWDNGGQYIFNPKKIGYHHQLNQNAVSFAMSQNIPAIVVDNTNTQNWEMQKYVELAQHYGYKVVIVEVPHVDIDTCEARNSHDVPREVLEKMASNLAGHPYRGPGTDGDKL
jgi:hypothetical protein